MKLKIVEKEKDRAVFLLEGVTEARANTVRRMIINNVPTLAIEEVSIQKNSSALYDEMLAHRLGLIPLKTDLKSYKLQEECSCEGKGCAQCTLALSLKAKGPVTVYSQDIESEDPKVAPAVENIPIVKLFKNQELKCEATAVMGTGKRHMKFAPGLVFYRGYPIIAIDKRAGIKKCIEMSKDNLAEKGSELVIKNVAKWTEADEEACEKNGMIVTASKEDFIFTIEAWGQLSPKEMLLKAVDVYDCKLDEFSKLVKKL